MRAVVCEALGDPCKPLGAGVLRLVQDGPDPPLPRGHVRISVAAAGLNFPDALIIKGEYQDKPPLPFVPGSEVSGVVAEVAPDVAGMAVGDAVCAVVTRGGFASSVVAPAAATWKVPAGLDLEAAAGVAVTYGTTHLALLHRAKLAAGQTLLVLGASGGVGTAAVQVGLLRGARVIAVTHGASKVAYLRRLGAHEVVDAAEEGAAPLHARIKALAPKGVDVVYDPVGGALLAAALKAIAWGGQYLVIGFAAGSIPKVPANLLLVKNVTMHGIFWGSYMARDPAVLRRGLDEVLGWMAQGRLAVQVSHRFPLEELPSAMAALLGRQVSGKVLITMADGSAPRRDGPAEQQRQEQQQQQQQQRQLAVVGGPPVQGGARSRM